MAKRILIFSFVYYPRFVGGAEIAIKEITDRMGVGDAEFDLIALRFDKSLPRMEKVGNVTVHRVGWSGRQKTSSNSLPFYLNLNKYVYPFIAAAKAFSLHAKQPFDMMWAMMANYSGFGALFFKLFHMQVPFILSLQEGDPIEYIKNESFKIRIGRIKVPVRFMAYPLFKLIFRHADKIQTISNYLADFARSMNATCPIVVVPNGVDIGRFSQEYSKEELDVLRNDLKKGPEDVFLITTSRLVVKNAVGDIVKSLVHLPSHVKLIILGTGYEEADLRKSAVDLGLSDRVLFLGYVPHDDMPKYLKISDIFIRPSLSEGFGNSFVEAMAAGIPVIATPVGGIVDFLINKETGLFCDVGSPEDIARKVEIYLHDKDLRAEIIDNASHMVREHYDWQMVARDMREEVFGII